MVPPIYKKPPGPKDTGGQTGNLLYKYYTTHWQNVNDTMLIWCGSKNEILNSTTTFGGGIYSRTVKVYSFI